MKRQKNINQKAINERIKKVNGAMAQEGMPLTKGEKEILKNCIIGKTTHAIERKKILSSCRNYYER